MYSPILEGGVSPIILAGPAFAYKSGVTGIAQGNRIENSEISETFNNFDIGAMLGVGVKLPIESNELQLIAKYNWGFANVANEKNCREDCEDEIFDIKNRVISLEAAFGFDLAK